MAGCCECIFPNWDKCVDEPKDKYECVVPYTNKTAEGGGIAWWSDCDVVGLSADCDFGRSVTYQIVEVIGSGSIECYAYGASTMTNCDPATGTPLEDEWNLFLMEGNTIELMTNNDWCTLCEKFEPLIRCRSLIDVPTIMKWSWSVRSATQCCGPTGLRYDAKSQNCVCDLRDNSKCRILPS